MSRRILIQVATPVVLIGLALCGVCLVSAWHVNRMQANLANILAQNVSSVQAAKHLEVNARQLRFNCFLYLIDPDPAVLREIHANQEEFEKWLDRASKVTLTQREREHMRAIREGYDRYRAEFERARTQVERNGPRRDYREVVLEHPIRHVADACREYALANEEEIAQVVREGEQVARWLHLTMLLVALGGPLGGLISGYGIARGLSRSLYQLSVRVHGMARQFDQDVAAVHLTPDGDLRQLDAQLQDVVARVTEVTQRLHQQQVEMLRTQQLAAVGQLAASVAHEVRNPLSAIKMLVEAALRDHNPRPMTEDGLRVVLAEVVRLERTVQNFLDFARPPALRRCPCDLREVVGQAVKLVRARARQQKVLVEWQAPGEPVAAHADNGQLYVVLVNLLVNALDAMPGGGRLCVRLEAGRRSAARITVADTGAGIGPEMMDQLFTPFVSSKPTGSGLGLSISRRIVEEHGGDIAAANLAEGGARFTVSLPAGPNEESNADTAGN